MKRCPKCAGIYSDDIKICDDCKIELVDKENFSKASYELREKEFQKNTQHAQIDTKNSHLRQEPQTKCIPKCPTCGSTDIAPISGLERGVSVLALGLFSKKINKSFKCGHCGYTW